MNAVPIIKAERVTLRPLTENDVDSWFEIYSDGEVLRYWGRAKMTAKSEAEERLRSIDEEIRNGELLQWGVTLNTNGKVIGTCMLTNIEQNSRRAEIAYLLNRAFWRQGLMREALIALLNYAFNEMNLNRIEANVNENNEPSFRILEKLGFQREGYMRERGAVGGEKSDTVLFGLLHSKWQQNADI